MVTLDIGLLAGILGVLGTLGGAIALIWKLLHRFERMERKSWDNGQHIRVMYRALFACLDGLKQLGCNGEVSRAIEEMKNRLIDE